MHELFYTSDKKFCNKSRQLFAVFCTTLEKVIQDQCILLEKHCMSLTFGSLGILSVAHSADHPHVIIAVVMSIIVR